MSRKDTQASDTEDLEAYKGALVSLKRSTHGVVEIPDLKPEILDYLRVAPTFLFAMGFQPLGLSLQIFPLVMGGDLRIGHRLTRKILLSPDPAGKICKIAAPVTPTVFHAGLSTLLLSHLRSVTTETPR